MKTIIKSSLCLVLTLLLAIICISCTDKKDSNSSDIAELKRSVFDPRGVEGFVMDGFVDTKVTGLDVGDSPYPFHIAYKCPESVPADMDNLELTLFYGYGAYSEPLGSKTLESSQVGHGEIACKSDSGSLTLERCIPYDEIKLSYVLSEKKASCENPEHENSTLDFYLLNYGRSGDYRIPLTALDKEQGKLSLTLTLYGVEKANNRASVELCYVKKDGNIKLYTSDEFDRLSKDPGYTPKGASGSSGVPTLTPAKFDSPDPREEDGFVKAGFWDIHSKKVSDAPGNPPEFQLAVKAPAHVDASDERMELELLAGYYYGGDADYDHSADFEQEFSRPFCILASVNGEKAISLKADISAKELSEKGLTKQLTPCTYSDARLGVAEANIHSYTFSYSLPVSLDIPEQESGFIKLCFAWHTDKEESTHSTDTLFDSVVIFYQKSAEGISFYTYSEYAALAEK